MFNAYPDSIGETLSDIVKMMQRPEFIDVFSLFYILPTVFNSDLDRGFSVIDYDLNEALVSPEDLNALRALNINFKFDLVLNHLSVGSPQFQDLLERGDDSEFKSFFINWNEFWEGNGTMGHEGYIIPNKEHLDKLFMRKPGLPILKVRFPDGSERPYWNTFYQQVTYPEFTAIDFMQALGPEKIDQEEAEALALLVNHELNSKGNSADIQLNSHAHLKADIVAFVERNRQYLGQMDLNAQSPLVWEFYEQTFKKLNQHGARMIRLDAFAYLHKEPGQTNFFNKPGTWEYLAKLRQLAEKYDLILLPEIHSPYGTGLHNEVSDEAYPIYDFFLPGLIIHTLDTGSNKNLYRWIAEIQDKQIRTVNMLGCHDGIPVLDLKSAAAGGSIHAGLLSDEDIDDVIETVLDRGGLVKNLYGPDGKKISYYQVNATFYSALGEDDQKLLLARAVQIFMPGIPQVWYLDLFAGKNDYEAAARGDIGGHKEINRTTLTEADIEAGLQTAVVQDQLTLLRLRNTSPAFNGSLQVETTEADAVHMTWTHEGHTAELKANLQDFRFSIMLEDPEGKKTDLPFTNN
ncbi:MAG: glycosidase [Candidatus Marinimicrobia bacterium]|nr:glycosidase [Candidatus Neomarinimicrobiota bacterium]